MKVTDLVKQLEVGGMSGDTSNMPNMEGGDFSSGKMNFDRQN